MWKILNPKSNFLLLFFKAPDYLQNVKHNVEGHPTSTHPYNPKWTQQKPTMNLIIHADNSCYFDFS